MHSATLLQPTAFALILTCSILRNIKWWMKHWLHSWYNQTAIKREYMGVLNWMINHCNKLLTRALVSANMYFSFFIFSFCQKGLKLWPRKWKLSGTTFLWCRLHRSIVYKWLFGIFFPRVNGEELVYAHHTTLKVFKISFCLRLVVFLQWQGKEFK